MKLQLIVLKKKLARNENFNRTMVIHSPKLYAQYWKKTIEALEEPIYNPSLPMYATESCNE